MLAKEMLVQQFEYNAWANGRILAEAARVAQDQLEQPSRVGDRSLLQILVHLVQMEVVWRLLAQNGRIEDDARPGADQLATAEAIREMLEAEHATMADYLGPIRDADLAEVVVLRRGDGSELSLARWQMLAHLLFHSMQHRSEAAVILTELGYSPGDIDFLFYLAPW